MTEHDPLAGKNPFPREQLDLLGLSRERADLLEEIVSTPATGPSSPRSRVLLPIGIAAALAIVGGGVWFATSGDDESADDPVVAASTTPEPSEATEPDAAEPTNEAEPTEETTPDDDSQVGEVDDLDGARPGDVVAPEVCRELRAGWRVRSPGALLLRGKNELRVVRDPDGDVLRLRDLRSRLADLSGLERLPRSAHAYYLDGPRGPWVAVDGDCTVVARGKGPWADVYLIDRD